VVLGKADGVLLRGEMVIGLRGEGGGRVRTIWKVSHETCPEGGGILAPILGEKGNHEKLL